MMLQKKSLEVSSFNKAGAKFNLPKANKSSSKDLRLKGTLFHKSWFKMLMFITKRLKEILARSSKPNSWQMRLIYLLLNSKGLIHKSIKLTENMTEKMKFKHCCLLWNWNGKTFDNLLVSFPLFCSRNILQQMNFISQGKE